MPGIWPSSVKVANRSFDPAGSRRTESTQPCHFFSAYSYRESSSELSGHARPLGFKRHYELKNGLGSMGEEGSNRLTPRFGVSMQLRIRIRIWHGRTGFLTLTASAGIRSSRATMALTRLSQYWPWHQPIPALVRRRTAWVLSTWHIHTSLEGNYNAQQ
jgi:hypothetical protein